MVLTVWYTFFFQLRLSFQNIIETDILPPGYGVVTFYVFFFFHINTFQPSNQPLIIPEFIGINYTCMQKEKFRCMLANQFKGHNSADKYIALLVFIYTD